MITILTSAVTIVTIMTIVAVAVAVAIIDAAVIDHDLAL
jgi:hypothetical protein